MRKWTTTVIAIVLGGTGVLLAQVPPEERIPIRDPDRLEELGLPRDAENVALWSKASWRASHGRQADGFRPATPATFGTADSGYSPVLGYELQGLSKEFFKVGSLALGTYCETGSAHATATARIPVPEGALLEEFRWWATDCSADEDLHFNVFETCHPGSSGGAPATTLIGQSDSSGSSGSQSGATSLGDLTADNFSCAYSVQVQFFGPPNVSCFGDCLTVHKLRIQWKRQISPAPAVASFLDVPTTHPFFRHIEALFDSGITSGCQMAPPMYCPERSITRGEMAVFLAKALGLHWPE
jgi:hypothetical protein